MRLSVGVAASGPHVLLEAAPPPGYVSKPHKPIGSLSRTLAELYLGLRWCSFKDLVAVHITLGEVPAARGRSQHRIPLLTSPTALPVMPQRDTHLVREKVMRVLPDLLYYMHEFLLLFPSFLGTRDSHPCLFLFLTVD